MTDEHDNVIHLSFRSDGTVERIGPSRRGPDERSGKERAADERAVDERAVDERAADGHGARSRESVERGARDPLADLYSRREVARLFGWSDGRLRGWERSGFLPPSAGVGRRRFYTFQDLIGLRAAKGLLDRGVPLKEVRRSVEALRTALPKCVRPLTELRVTAEGTSLLVRDELGMYEPTTGQRVIDFCVEELKDDVVRVLRAKTSAEDQASAYELYLEGCRLDEDEATYERAERAYERAIALDPSLSNALTNLGNLCYRRGDVERAENCYSRALEVDAEQPEAHYNFGFLHLERGDPSRAAECFRRALEHDPSFADAHFNLAMACEELGERERARGHWESYLALEPKGPWAEIARRHLA